MFTHDLFLFMHYKYVILLHPQPTLTCLYALLQVLELTCRNALHAWPMLPNQHLF